MNNNKQANWITIEWQFAKMYTKWNWLWNDKLYFVAIIYAPKWTYGMSKIVKCSIHFNERVRKTNDTRFFDWIHVFFYFFFSLSLSHLRSFLFSSRYPFSNRIDLLWRVFWDKNLCCFLHTTHHTAMHERWRRRRQKLSLQN